MRSAHFMLTLCILASCSTAYSQGQVLNETLQHDGLTRSYTLYTPPSYTGDAAWPLVFNLHGGRLTGTQQMLVSGMNAVADTGNFLVAYPNATASHVDGFSLWNDGVLFPNGPDDVGFISAMIDELASDYHIDSSRVYATGISSGGAMSFYLGSQLSHRLAAIAPVAAPRPANPTAPRPLPLLYMHGTADQFVPIDGGFNHMTPPNVLPFLPIADVIDDWRQSNGSVGEPVVTQLPDLNTQDRSAVRLIRYDDGERYLTSAGVERSAEVLYYMIEGGGHTWPGGGGGFLPPIFGPVNRDINASTEIWNFFSRHELPTVVPEVTCTTDVDSLWPPNHKMMAVRVSIQATDLCTDSADLELMEVVLTSSEPDNASGDEDGNTTGDTDGKDGFTAPVNVTEFFTFNPATECFEGTVFLRAERAEDNIGRTYTIEATVMNNDNNWASSRCSVVVPGDLSL